MPSRTVFFFLLAAFLAAPAASQQRMYKCMDAKGKVYYTQIPPQECLGRATDELNKSGRVINRNEVPPTAEQRAAREAARTKKLEDDAKAKEERRKNMSLLNTYSSEKDVEDARARALAGTEAAIKASERRIADLQKRQKELEAEKDFYAKKTLPSKLTMDIRNTEFEIQTQTDSIEAKKKDMSVINAKYDEDKRKYLELTRAPAAPAAKAKKR